MYHYAPCGGTPSPLWDRTTAAQGRSGQNRRHERLQRIFASRRKSTAIWRLTNCSIVIAKRSNAMRLIAQHWHDRRGPFVVGEFITDDSRLPIRVCITGAWPNTTSVARPWGCRSWKAEIKSQRSPADRIEKAVSLSKGVVSFGAARLEMLLDLGQEVNRKRMPSLSHMQHQSLKRSCSLSGVLVFGRILRCSCPIWICGCCLERRRCTAGLI
jgi:hypothetical protein